MHDNNTIDYIEFGVTNMGEAKQFYGEVFGWEFTDYSPTYAGIKGVDKEMGGFTEVNAVKQGGILPVLYSDSLEECLVKVQKAGGTLVKEIFSFPGGRRFEFSDLSGNIIAVWSDV